jgi:hypothetical protein
MSKPALSPLQRFRHKYCGDCNHRDACLSGKSIDLRCLLAALLDAASRRIEEGEKGGAENV